MHVVCQWIGNSAAVAAKHYLQVTDEHFLQASKEAVQNPVQQAHGNPCNGWQENTATPGFSERFPGVARVYKRSMWAALDSNQRLPPCEATPTPVPSSYKSQFCLMLATPARIASPCTTRQKMQEYP